MNQQFLDGSEYRDSGEKKYELFVQLMRDKDHRHAYELFIRESRAIAGEMSMKDLFAHYHDIRVNVGEKEGQRFRTEISKNFLRMLEDAEKMSRGIETIVRVLGLDRFEYSLVLNSLDLSDEQKSFIEMLRVKVERNKTQEGSK